jgi:hypothetical protein
MVVDQPHRLHEGVDRGRADELPAALLQVLRQRDGNGLGSTRRWIKSQWQVIRNEDRSDGIIPTRARRTFRAWPSVEFLRSYKLSSLTTNHTLNPNLREGEWKLPAPITCRV